MITLSAQAHTVYRRLVQFDVAEITLGELAHLTGMSKNKVRSALLELEEKELATIEEGR